MVPPMAVMFAKDPRVKNFDLSCIKSVLVGAAPLKKQTEAMLRQVFGSVDIMQGEIFHININILLVCGKHISPRNYTNLLDIVY